MRCPKCGYISFDHLEACGKCKKDLSAVVAELGGGSYGAEVPRFLVTQTEPDEVAEDFGGVVEDEGIVFDEEFEDSELDILVTDGDEADIALEDDDGPEIVMDSGDEGIAFDDELPEVDLGVDEAEEFQFDEPEAEDGEIAISIPDELADISDLSAPAEADDEADISFAEEPVVETPVATEPDLDLDDLNLELDPLEELVTDKAAGSKDFELSLDEIDFSETVPETPEETAAGDDPLNMDSELDFELDLGGLTLNKDK